jgi:hypothetical protein
MLYFKDVPIVIEPGVAALEVALYHKTKKAERLFYVQFARVQLTSDTVDDLPFILASSAPHLFTMTEDLKTSPFLLVYDYRGKLQSIYTREKETYHWVRNDAAPEQVGDTVTQFSVRFSFNSIESREKFLMSFYELTDDYKTGGKKDKPTRDLPNKVRVLADLLSECRNGPVVLPIAVAKYEKPAAV